MTRPKLMIGEAQVTVVWNDEPVRGYVDRRTAVATLTRGQCTWYRTLYVELEGVEWCRGWWGPEVAALQVAHALRAT